MEYCVYCTEEVGDLTKIMLPTGVTSVYICKTCAKYLTQAAK